MDSYEQMDIEAMDIDTRLDIHGPVDWGGLKKIACNP